MGQTDLKPNINDDSSRHRPISKRAARVFLCGASVAALSVFMASQDAQAQGLVITNQYYPGGSTTVLHRFSGTGNVRQLKDGAPGNNCPIPAFEIVNPRPGEARCVGYVAPSWLTR
jgi:hypothetical protein